MTGDDVRDAKMIMKVREFCSKLYSEHGKKRTTTGPTRGGTSTIGAIWCNNFLIFATAETC